MAPVALRGLGGATGALGARSRTRRYSNARHEAQGGCGKDHMAGYGAGRYGRAGELGTTSIQGFAGLQRALRRLEDGSQAELRARILAIGDQVALVAASNAPRGATGELQHSIRRMAFAGGASVYSEAIYGGVQNVGAWTRNGRGPHVRRARASHYMDKAVTQLEPYVQSEVEAVMNWLMTTFQED